MKLKPWYHVTEIAGMLGIKRRGAQRWLARRGIRTEAGRVWLADLKNKIPDVWDSVNRARIDSDDDSDGSDDD